MKTSSLGAGNLPPVVGLQGVVIAPGLCAARRRVAKWTAFVVLFLLPLVVASAGAQNSVSFSGVTDSIPLSGCSTGRYTINATATAYCYVGDYLNWSTLTDGAYLTLGQANFSGTPFAVRASGTIYLFSHGSVSLFDKNVGTLTYDFSASAQPPFGEDSVTGIAVDASGTLFVAAAGQGIWKITLSAPNASAAQLANS
jgi:hypothetical protein